MVEAIVEKVIALVQKYPILYDLSHSDYKNVRIKNKTWDKIGLELNKNGEDIKKKWRNLRDTYAKYLRSIKTKTGQPAKKNYKHWQWAKHMEFLRPFLAFAPTDSNILALNEEGTISEYDIPEAEQTQAIDEEEQQEELVESPSLPLENMSDTPSLVNSKIQSQQNLQTRQKKKYRGEKKSSSVDRVVQYLETKRSRSDDRTANELIFAGYARTVNTFRPKRQAITRMKIAEIIAEQELLHIEEVESMSRSSSSIGSHCASTSVTPLPEYSPTSPNFDHTPDASNNYISSGQFNYISLDQSHIPPKQPNYTSSSQTCAPSQQLHSSVQSFIAEFDTTTH